MGPLYVSRLTNMLLCCRYLAYDDVLVGFRFVGRHITGCQEQIGLAMTIVARLVLRRGPLDVVHRSVLPGGHVVIVWQQIVAIEGKPAE